MRAAKAIGLWLLDHFSFLVCLGLGIAAGVQHRAELAIGFFVMGMLIEVAAVVSAVRRDLAALRKELDR